MLNMFHILLGVVGFILLCFSIFGMYIFVQVIKMAYLQSKIIKLSNGTQSPEQMKETLLDFAERYNQKYSNQNQDKKE